MLIIYDTYAQPDFVAEDLAACKDVEIPELGLLPPVERELKQDALEDREALEVDADEGFLPEVEHVGVDGNLEEITADYGRGISGHS